MEIVVYILPFITALFLLFVFNKKMVWWEYAVLLLVPILIVSIMHIIMIHTNSMDTEYLGGYVKKITYYEEWDEMVLKTKTRRVPSGRDSNGHTTYRTEVYTVLEREYHPERWVYVDNNSDIEHRISKKTYNIIKCRLNSPSIFRDMERRYHRIDGDAYDTYWNGDVYTIYELTSSHKYKNKVKSRQSNTIFKLGEISENDVKELGLYEYPKITDLTQPPIIGKQLSDKDIQRIKYINATYGKAKEFRMYVLLYENKDFLISEYQKEYWQNGNKNEFVVCLGIKGDSVTWCNPFSWCDKPELEALTREYFNKYPKLDIDKYGQWLQTQIPTKWTRKEFKDFDYINIYVSRGQGIALLITMIVLCVGLSIFLVRNDIEN